MLSRVKENRQFGFRTFPFSASSVPANPHGTKLSVFVRRCDPSVGTEELAHLEMIGAIVYQLTKDLSMEEIKKAGFDAYFVDHTTGIYPAAANGTPYNAFSMAVKGDVLTDLHEDLAAEGTTA